MDSFVGPYRILRLVNQGGQGGVYLGYDKRLHRRVAIKIRGLPRNRAERKRLLHEAQLVVSIQSPKVVQVYDVIESGSHLALVMEYVPGCSLEDLLSRTRPSLASVLRVGTDVAGALALARQQHIVHGDVKAGNVLITRTGRAKLTDFGIARDGRETVELEWGGGSASALAPEQVLGESLDERTDLFALGCLLYRMMSGEHPFFRNGQFDPGMLVTEAPRPLAEVVTGDVELPDALAALIDALLEKDPRRRPPNTRRVRQVLRVVGRDLPVSSRDSLLKEARPYFRREPDDDLPPLIPEGLGQRGRSALAPTGSRLARCRHWLSALRWPARAALALAVGVLAAIPLGAFHRYAVTPVRFEEPVTAVPLGTPLPRGVSSGWLLGQVKTALGDQLGTIRVVGPVGADPVTTLYPRGKPAKRGLRSEQTFQLALNCVQGLCVFAISRQEDGNRFHRQGVLLPHMSIKQWQDVVRDTTLALYR